MPFSSYNHLEYSILHFHESRYILSLTYGRHLVKFVSSSYIIVNQFKLMSASPDFKIDQKIYSMLVKCNCNNQHVFSTECKSWTSKRKETTNMKVFFLKKS